MRNLIYMTCFVFYLLLSCNSESSDLRKYKDSLAFETKIKSFHLKDSLVNSTVLPLPETKEIVSIDSVKAVEQTIEEKLQIELAGYYAYRSLCQDILTKMRNEGVVDRNLRKSLRLTIQDQTVNINLNKFDGVKFYKEDYQKIYKDLETEFYTSYPYLK